MTTLDDIAKRLDRLESMLAVQKSVLTIGDVALLTGYSVKYLRRLTAEHEIPYYRRGNRVFFARNEVEDWQTANRVKPNEEITNQAAAYVLPQKRKKKE